MTKADFDHILIFSFIVATLATLLYRVIVGALHNESPLETFKKIGKEMFP
jgi:hypothetical protein